MILGRPANLWTGLATGVIGALSVTLVALGADATLVATLSGAWSIVIGSVIALLANQPPTLSPGDTFQIQTPAGEPNQTGIVVPPDPVTVKVPEP